jgi:hypothetical protein
MCLAEQAAMGNRPRVLEDGPDTLNSDDEAKEDVKPDELSGVYTSEMDPELGPKKLSPSEVSQQKAAAQALKEFSSSSPSRFTTSSSPEVSSDFGNSIVNSAQSSRQSSRQSTPMNSDNEDDMSDEQKRLARNAKRKASKAAMTQEQQQMIDLAQRCTSIPRCSSAPGEKPSTRRPAKSQPAQAQEPKGCGNLASRSRDDAGPSQKVPQPLDSKAAASPRAPAGRTQSKGDIGLESPTPTKGSRAGGFQSVGGSGQKDTCVPQRHPSQTGVVIFPSAEVSSHT